MLSCSIVLENRIEVGGDITFFTDIVGFTRDDTVTRSTFEFLCFCRMNSLSIATFSAPDALGVFVNLYLLDDGLSMSVLPNPYYTSVVLLNLDFCPTDGEIIL